MDTRTGEFYIIEDEEGDARRELAELRGLKGEADLRTEEVRIRKAAFGAKTYTRTTTPVSPRFTKAYVNNSNRKTKRKLARMSKRANRG